ncbi:MAG: hypothetical protein MJ244_00300 [Clostridia bacterium]|nr:hypothetical protein [Clostridia bacterium]
MEYRIGDEVYIIKKDQQGNLKEADVKLGSLVVIRLLEGEGKVCDTSYLKHDARKKNIILQAKGEDGKTYTYSPQNADDSDYKIVMKGTKNIN